MVISLFLCCFLVICGCISTVKQRLLSIYPHQKKKKTEFPTPLHKPTSKGVESVSGCVEKLVRGRWTDRFITISVGTTSIHYYLSKNDERKQKVRGIYPLMNAKVDEGAKEDGRFFPFTVCLVSGQKVRFRTERRKATHAWSLIISHLATKIPDKKEEPVEGVLSVKSGMSWSKRAASLDPGSKTITLGKSDRQSLGSKPAETYNLEGGSVCPVKSYGKTFDFEVTVISSSDKSVELRLRTASEGDRVMWCQAIEGAINNETKLQLNVRHGLEEGVISVTEATEEKHGGGEVQTVILKGLHSFSPRIAMRIGYFLQPHPLIHRGGISKVYHTNMKTVSEALQAAGFILGSSDCEDWVFELKEKRHLSLESVTTISSIINILWPAIPTSSSRPSSAPSSSSSSLLPPTLANRNDTKSNGNTPVLSRRPSSDRPALMNYKQLPNE